MVVKHEVEGYENFKNFMDNLKTDGRIFILYTGSKLPSGESWCPDCVEAKPYLEKGLKLAPENAQYIIVEVGPREYWKDFQCPFRTDSKLQVKVLPTLVEWGTPKRLEGDQCENIDLIQMLIEDE